MPSLLKTAFLQLNKWAGNEYPKREDFVSDNEKIDAFADDISSQMAQMGNNDKEARNAINNLKFELEEKGLVDFINNNTGIGYYDNFKDNDGIDLLNTTASVDNVNKIVNFDTGETLKFKQQSFFGASKIEIKISHLLSVDFYQK